MISIAKHKIEFEFVIKIIMKYKKYKNYNTKVLHKMFLTDVNA